MTSRAAKSAHPLAMQRMSFAHDDHFGRHRHPRAYRGLVTAMLHGVREAQILRPVYMVSSKLSYHSSRAESQSLNRLLPSTFRSIEGSQGGILNGYL